MMEDTSQPAPGEATANEQTQINDSSEKNVEELLFKYLMQGGQLLDSCCPSCQNPLVKEGETPDVMSPTTLNSAATISFDGDESESGQDDDKLSLWTPVKGVPFCVACEATVVTTEMELAYASERLALTGRSQKKGSMIVALNTAENDMAGSLMLTLPTQAQEEAPCVELKESVENQQNMCPLGIAPLMLNGFKSMAEVPTPTMGAGIHPHASPLSAMGIEHEVNNLPSCDSTNVHLVQVTIEVPANAADESEEIMNEVKETENAPQVDVPPDEEAGAIDSGADEEPEMDYREKRALATKILGSKMLQGYTLQQSPCEECNMPLMEKKGNIGCVVCPAMAAKTDKWRQQKLLEREQKRAANSKPEPVVEPEKPQVIRSQSLPVAQQEEKQTADRTCATEARCEEGSEARSVHSPSPQQACPETSPSPASKLESNLESEPTLHAAFSEHSLEAERAERERIETERQVAEQAQREEAAKAEVAIMAAFSEDALAAENAERERIVRERLEERMEKERLERELARREAEEREQAILDERRRIEMAKQEADEREQAVLAEKKRIEEEWFVEQQALALELGRLEEEKHDRDIEKNSKPKSDVTAGSVPVEAQAAADDPWMLEQSRLQEEVRKLEEQEEAMKVARKRLEKERNAMVEKREAAEAAAPSRSLHQQAEKEARARARLMLALEQDAVSAALATTSSPLSVKPPSLRMGTYMEQTSVQAVPPSPSQQVPATPRTAMKWEKLRNKSRSEMSKRMMQGWTLSDDCCKGRECHGMFLLADTSSAKLFCSVCQGTGSGKDAQYKAGGFQSEVPRLTSPSQIQPSNANSSFGNASREMHLLSPSRFSNMVPNEQVAKQQVETEAAKMQLLAKTHPSSAAPLSPRAIVVTTSQSIQQERQDEDTRFASGGIHASERYGVEKRAPLPPTSFSSRTPMRPPRPMTSNRSEHMSEEHLSTLPNAMKHKPFAVSHTPQDDDGNCSVLSDASSRAKSIASDALGLIMEKIERAKGQLNVPGEQGDLASQMEVASLIEKLASAAIAVRRLEELS